VVFVGGDPADKNHKPTYAFLSRIHINILIVGKFTPGGNRLKGYTIHKQFFVKLCCYQVQLTRKFFNGTNLRLGIAVY
jgi:hypothetical protein